LLLLHMMYSTNLHATFWNLLTCLQVLDCEACTTTSSSPWRKRQ
jgi:hypothetical protein